MMTPTWAIWRQFWAPRWSLQPSKMVLSCRRDANFWNFQILQISSTWSAKHVPKLLQFGPSWFQVGFQDPQVGPKLDPSGPQVGPKTSQEPVQKAIRKNITNNVTEKVMQHDATWRGLTQLAAGKGGWGALIIIKSNPSGSSSGLTITPYGP